MKKFTNDEKAIARNIDEEYKWIARDRDGNLCVYDGKPKKRNDIWFSDGYEYIFYFNHLFPAIKWEDEEPTRIRDIYNPSILNGAEQKYLKTILEPFHDEVEYIKKIAGYDKEHLFIAFYCNGAFSFPDFDPGTMYSGMESGKAYSLDELGITYVDAVTGTVEGGEQ